MKPGIPWSVKGIEQQARAAAKQAARRSGMTIGEWLNTVILDSADDGDDLERRYRRPPYRPKQLPGGEAGQGEEVTLRLEEIAEQLHTIARHESDTAVARQTSPEDEAALRAIVERLDSYEQHTSSALGAMQERLEVVSERLGRLPEHKLPERPEDVPGFRTLEGALRNIIEHIEVSETRTRDAIRAVQERLAEATDQTGSAALSLEPDQHLARLRGDIDSLNQRFDDMTVDAVSQRDVDALRLELEQLAATVSQASGHALSDLEQRVEALSQRLDAENTAAAANVQLDELSARVLQLEAELKSQSAEPDAGTQRQVAALAERITATEQRLEHLATIERSVAQLAQSLESSRSAAAEPFGSGHTSEGSPELKALEDGLKAVRASAELSDRRTQDTLQAVHETLEHIVAKLTELESQPRPDGEDTSVERAEASQEAGETPLEAPVEEAAQAPMPPGEADLEPTTEPAAEELSVPQRSEADAMAAMASDTKELTATPEPLAETALDDARQEGVVPSADEPESEATEPAGGPVREDYIAAARRAAQMAATRNQNPVASGFNRFSQRLTGAGKRSGAPADDSAPASGVAPSLLSGLRLGKAKTGDEPQPAAKSSTRNRLIVAGLVLLAAVSAYGAHRHADLLPSLKLLPGTLSGPPAANPAKVEKAALQQVAAEPEATRPVSALARQRTESLPAEIGRESLRQAALAGDAKAQFVVANRYLEGRVVARDEEQAGRWYKRAAMQGLAAAQYRLGSMYEHGRGMPLDRQAAQVWYEKAAGRGNVKAMHNLAVLYSDATTGRAHYELAADWFRKAAERGLKDSQFNLAVLSEQGLGVPQSRQEAVFWYSLAAAQGDEEAAAKAEALESSLAPEGAQRVHGRLAAWQPLAADHAANFVPDGITPAVVELAGSKAR